MYRFGKPDTVVFLSATLVGQSLLTVGLICLCKAIHNDKMRYSEAIVYYDDIIHRENVTLTQYDHIVLQTIFEPEAVQILEGEDQ